jgi:cyclophilin family peptidyl-prolyl cis-trans isomerase
MQNYTNYIIGFCVVLALGWLIYVLQMPSSNQSAQSEDGSRFGANESAYATSTESGEQTQLATTSAQSKMDNKIENKNTNMQTQKETYKVTMETNKGTIVLELNTKIAPKTVENFVKLADSGFYNGVKFHRVIKDFMIQSGDPQSKDDKLVNAWGTGGPGYKFADEIFDTGTYRTGYKRGILAMANSGPNTNGSQFFIMHKDVPLPPNYTIFGKVVSGLETVDSIANVQTLPNDRPIEAVVINKVTVD